MFEFIKDIIKDKKLPNFKQKYQISYNAKENLLDEFLLYIPKPIEVLKVTNRTYEAPKKEQVVLKKGSIVWVKNNYYYNKIEHEDLCEIAISNNSFRTFNRYSSSKDYEHFYINKNFLYKYAIPYKNNISIKITSANDVLSMDLEKIKVYYWEEEKIANIFYLVTDIFKNFEPEVINQFAPGIIDTLKNFLELINSEFADKGTLIDETNKYIKEIYNTISSFGEEIKYFPTPLELVDEDERRKNEEKRKAEEERNRQKQLYEERQKEFLEKTKNRRQLLKDFNEPLENIPKKLAKKNEELKNRWKKEG